MLSEKETPSIMASNNKKSSLVNNGKIVSDVPNANYKRNYDEIDWGKRAREAEEELMIVKLQDIMDKAVILEEAADED